MEMLVFNATFVHTSQAKLGESVIGTRMMNDDRHKSEANS